MKIYEIHQKKRTYMPLLLLADEQPEMIETYLSRGRMFVLDDGGVKAECVVTDEGSGLLEIKNIAVQPECQGRGYGMALIRYIKEQFRRDFTLL